jgi:hypothetical protein
MVVPVDSGCVFDKNGDRLLPPLLQPVSTSEEPPSNSPRLLSDRMLVIKILLAPVRRDYSPARQPGTFRLHWEIGAATGTNDADSQQMCKHVTSAIHRVDAARKPHSDAGGQ